MSVKGLEHATARQPGIESPHLGAVVKATERQELELGLRKPLEEALSTATICMPPHRAFRGDRIKLDDRCRGSSHSAHELG